MNPIIPILKRHYLYPFFLNIVFLLCTSNLNGQHIEKLFNKADQLFQESQFEKASKQYLKIIKSDTYYEKAYVQLARCNVGLENYEEADRYFSEIFSKSEVVDPEYFLEYGQLLMIIGRYGEARTYFMSYNNLIEYNDLRVLRYIKSIEDIDKYYNDSSFIHLNKLPISTEGNDLNPRIYNQQLIFETNKDFINSTPLIKSLYYQSVNEISSKKSAAISGTMAQKNQSFGFAIAISTGELYRCMLDEKLSDDKIILFRSFIEDNGGQLSKGEQVNLEGWVDNIAYPTVNSTSNILIFSSNSVSSKGGWDLFISYRGTYGFSEPLPLQGFINTLGDELYPYLVNDSILFFASDGHGGLGGFDMYYVNINNTSEIPRNLGYPINSHYNEFGIALNNDQSVGYLSSDRDTERTLADLYSFSVGQIRALGVVTDKTSGENLKNVAVKITREGEESSHMILADNGHFNIVGTPGEEYNLTVWREGYTLESYKVATTQGRVIGLYEVDIGKFPIEPTDKPVPSPIPDSVTIITEEESMDELPPPVVVPPPATTVFRLQIAASRSPLSESEIRHKYQGDKEVFMFEEEGWYKYAIGEYTSYFEANHDRKQCGVPDAFIAAYDEGDHKMTLKSAIKQVHAQPAKLYSEQYTEPPGREIIKRNTVYFSFDLYEPDQVEMAKLDALVESLSTDPGIKVEIDGHTDLQGSSEYNFGLSQARAEFVKKYFVQKGINPQRITVVSFGENKLEQRCTDDCTPEIHKANRRAEIVLYR